MVVYVTRMNAARLACDVFCHTDPPHASITQRLLFSVFLLSFFQWLSSWCSFTSAIVDERGSGVCRR